MLVPEEVSIGYVPASVATAANMVSVPVQNNPSTFTQILNTATSALTAGASAYATYRQSKVKPPVTMLTQEAPRPAYTPPPQQGLGIGAWAAIGVGGLALLGMAIYALKR